MIYRRKNKTSQLRSGEEQIAKHLVDIIPCAIGIRAFVFCVKHNTLGYICIIFIKIRIETGSATLKHRQTLFVIRSAGNIVDGCTIGSVEYAVEHLGCRLVVVLGHTHCGAIKSTLAGPQEGPVAFITEEIRPHIREGATEAEAAVDNVNHSLSKLTDALSERDDVRFAGAMYDIEKGTVGFL